MYKTYMIVFSKDTNRLNNYNELNKMFNNKINKFNAINTIDNFEKWKNIALLKKYTTIDYINDEVLKNGLGKLGCNLSHQLLLEEIHNLETEKWFLILEDDVGIKSTYENINTFIIKLINNLNKDYPDTKFVQLCIYDNFYASQVKEKHLFEATYQKSFQYGTCAYLIRKDAVEHINKIKPININIDFLYNSLHKEFKSVATFNPYFYCKGSMDSYQRNTKLGSLIWDNKNKN